MSNFADDWVARFSRSPQFLDVDPECALAVGPDGRIAGMTHQAQRMLAASTGLGWHDAEHIIDVSFKSFFDLDLNDLRDLTRSVPLEERLISNRSGSSVFAHAIVPQPRPQRRRPKAEIPTPLARLYGSDPAMAQLAERAAKLADTPISILLQGETGSGKEVLARAIHSSRKVPGRYVAINCAALPESLIESELFGYAPGSFTGDLAKGKRGLIEQTNSGTLFLDEIGDMPLALQARLLRVLSEKEILPVGSDKAIPVDLRVLSATHKDLLTLVKTGKFREDLYYRLNGVVLKLSPLRERQDLEWLANNLLESAFLEERSSASTSGRCSA